MPDALMDRACPGDDVAFDPITLRVRSCRGWSEEDIQQTRALLDDAVAKHNGERSADTWQWPHPNQRNRDDMQLDPGADGEGMTAGDRQRLAVLVAGAQGWRLTAAQRSGTRWLIGVQHPAGSATIGLSSGAGDTRCYRELQGIQARYRVVDGESPTRQGATFDRLLEALASHVAEGP